MVLAALPHGNGRVLSEGRSAAPRDAEPDLPGDDAIHGAPVRRYSPAVHLPADRVMGGRVWFTNEDRSRTPTRVIFVRLLKNAPAFADLLAKQVLW